MEKTVSYTYPKINVRDIRVVIIINVYTLMKYAFLF